MHELLKHLPEGARVLDLGCGSGSFRADSKAVSVVRIDLERGSAEACNFAQADAARLPLPDHSVDLVISNHSLEHFDNLAGALQEVGRVLKPNGALYIAVPDASTVTDRLYRWLARGGGHVNPFTSAEQLASTVEHATGLRHVATRTLCTSLSFLNRHNCRTRPPGKLLFLGAGTQTSLVLFTYFLRLLDRFLRTRTSVYGWALYFGKIDTAINCQTWTNVCVRCGSGHNSDWLLRDRKLVWQALFVRAYQCPNCGNANLFTDDNRFAHLN